MTADTPEAEPKRGTMTFQRWNPKRARLPGEQAKRQGDITQLAFTLLGGRDGAIAFLNNADPGLGERPLDLAMASNEGYQRVETLIRQMAAKRA